VKDAVKQVVQEVKTSTGREGKPNGAPEQDENASQKAVIRKLGAALLVAVDARTYLAGMTKVVFPELKDVLKELPIGATPDEVQLCLATLVDYGLLECGFLIDGPITTYKMAPSSCHRNVATLWKQRQQGIVAIASGYALSDDGLWRQHSWGILRDGVLETTEQRSKYFGIVLQGLEADLFAANELGEKLPSVRPWPSFRRFEVGNVTDSIHQKWQIE
jgi:hypothetical protein